MHRLLVTLLLSLIALAGGCSSYVNPLTGATLAGGVPASSSRLLGFRLPAGMAYYAEHSRISGQDGVEILRGEAGPGACAASAVNGMQELGWTPRLGSASNIRAVYAYEKDGRMAVITIYPQSPTTMTLMIIYTSSRNPEHMPLPYSSADSQDRGEQTSAPFSETWDDGSPDVAGTYDAESGPVYEEGGITGRDI